MSRDIVTHFVRFSSIKYKIVHESFIVLQTVDPEKNIRKKKNSVVLTKKVKNFKDMGITIYKDEVKLLQNFKQYIFKKGKKKKLEKIIKDVDILVNDCITQIEEYKLKYQPQSPSI
ncbi:25733_t:CDS:2 [Dentiscutata erythropus]|uniref:25733_t:CDS:1 n=1 Tax=Dentiscutata erythropus TaxID=1348616 RepID=A0A9N9C291_9GLOM|nr:25733_t:CDS:2 [Dentiscutata erythropus]